MSKAKLKWVKGNKLTLMIPLEKQMVEGGTVIKEDYTPPSGSTISVTLLGCLHRHVFASVTQTENVLSVMDNGTLKEDVYAVEVIVIEPNGTKLRSMWKNMLEISCDNDGKLQEYNDFMGEDGMELEAAVFYSHEGGDVTNAVQMAYSRMGYYECDTAGGTAAKTVSATGYVLGPGGCIKVKMAAKNTASGATLKIGDAAARPLYYNGSQASAANSWEAGEVIEVWYDGEVYQSKNSGGGNGQQMVTHAATETSVSIQPNILHVWPAIASLTVAFVGNVYGKVNEYMIQFTSPSDAGTSLTLPQSVKWADSDELEPEAGMTYQVSILNDLAVWAEF